jgi:hypothetical protein
MSERSVVIDTRSAEMYSAWSTNQTTVGTAVVNPVDTQAKPNLVRGNGFIPMGEGGDMTSPGLFIIPYGIGSVTNTFLMAVFGVDSMKGGPPPTVSTWTSWLIASFTCTLAANATNMSAIAGAPNFTTGSTTTYCDTIAVLSGNANVSCEAISPAGLSVKALVTVDVKGAKLVNILFWMNGSATSANALWRRV